MNPSGQRGTPTPGESTLLGAPGAVLRSLKGCFGGEYTGCTERERLPNKSYALQVIQG